MYVIGVSLERKVGGGGGMIKFQIVQLCVELSLESYVTIQDILNVSTCVLIYDFIFSSILYFLP